MYRILVRLIPRAVALAAVLSLSSCARRVTLVPGEEDLLVLNGCVISAVNYLAVVKAQHQLEKNYWAKILLVRFSNNSAGHAFTIWETEGNIYGYDRNAGSFSLPVYTRDARSVAIVLSLELSKVLHKPLAVESADYVNANEAELFEFNSINTPAPRTTIATAFQIRSIARP